MSAGAIVLAAGRGERLGGGEPKGFVTVGGFTLLEHALRTVEACPEIRSAVVAAPPGLEQRASTLARGASKVEAVIGGGRSRQESVRLGLAALPDGIDAVVAHDVARPFASPALFRVVLEALVEADGAIPVVRVTDTVKRIADGGVETLPRDGLVLVQTPQAFRRAALEQAHRRAAREGYASTDDAALLERDGARIATVAGDPANIKVTTREDLRLAETLASALRR